jgi:hypothetical protein
MPRAWAKTAMSKIPKNDLPETLETTRQAVLDAISVRSAFVLPFRERIDRYHLIEATLAALPGNDDSRLLRELRGRRIETLLSVASFAARSREEFEAKATAIGQDFDFKDDGKITDQHLLLMMILTALTVDARRHGIEVQFSATKSGQDGSDKPH